MNFFWLDASACVKRYSELRTSGDNLVLISSDHRLLNAARNEGLFTFNPETDSQTTLDFFINSS